MSTRGLPQKTLRNKSLVQKRLTDPEKWSFGALGRYFKIHKTTAEDIFKRDRQKYESMVP